MKLPKKDGIQRLVLLDSHAILHRGYHALPDFSSSKGEPTGALYGLMLMLFNIIENLKPDYIAACFDLPKPTLRHELYEGYKSGRKKTDDELVTQIIRSHDIFKAFSIPEYSLSGFEADDMLGTITEQLKKRKDIEIIIASGDMDTMQLIDDEKVRVFTLKKGVKDTALYSEKEVVERFGFSPLQLPDYKGLAGDPSDNIIGIKGIGEKTATALVQKFGTLEHMYEAIENGKKKEFDALKITPRIYKLLEEGKDEALFSKMLATIRRDAPLEYKIPEKKWIDEISISSAKNILSELEFRSLLSRLDTIFKNNGGVESQENDEGAGAETLFKEMNHDPALLKKAAIGVWLLNSSITNPSLDDVLRFTKKEKLEDAVAVIEKEIESKGMNEVYKKVEIPLIPILESMQKYGIKIDRENLLKLGKSYHESLSLIEKEIWKLANKEFNVSSPKQLGEVLFTDLDLKAKRQKKTSTGALSTKESELEKLRELHPIIGKVLEYRELSKLLTTYIDVIPKLLDSNDRLHTTFIQSGATTGRMASEAPNLQNIPIKSELGRAIRKAFVADKGFVLGAFDYSQIELRIAAMLSQDEKLISIFQKGEDVHAGVAAQMFKVPFEDVTKEMRRKAKVINFGILYGMGVNALRENLKTTREEAQKFYDDYFNAFSKLAAWIDSTKASAQRLGYTTTMYGRRRYFEGIKSKLPYIRSSAERMAINAPIQGTQADIVKLAMVEITEALKKKNMEKDVRLLLQIHDELIFEIKEEKAHEASLLIKEIMEKIMNDKETRGVPVVANASLGPSWGELEEEK